MTNGATQNIHFCCTVTYVQMKAFADDKNLILLRLSRKHCSNRRNCWLQVFSPCPNMFFKSHRFKGQ